MRNREAAAAIIIWHEGMDEQRKKERGERIMNRVGKRMLNRELSDNFLAWKNRQQKAALEALHAQQAEAAEHRKKIMAAAFSAEADRATFGEKLEAQEAIIMTLHQEIRTAEEREAQLVAEADKLQRERAEAAARTEQIFRKMAAKETEHVATIGHLTDQVQRHKDVARYEVQKRVQVCGYRVYTRTQSKWEIEAEGDRRRKIKSK